MRSMRWRRSGEDSASLRRWFWGVRRGWSSELRCSRNLAANLSRCRSVAPTKRFWIWQLLKTESATDCRPKTRPIKLCLLLTNPVDNSQPDSSNNSVSILGPISSIIQLPLGLRNRASKLSPFVPDVPSHHECQIDDDQPGRDTIE